MPRTDHEPLMTIAELSAMLGVPVDTVYAWRHRGLGPAGYRIGRHVRFRQDAVEAWLAQQADERRGDHGDWPAKALIV